MSYAEDILAASEMIAEFGATASLSVQGTATYNPATGTSSASTSPASVSAVLLPLDKGRRYQMESMASGDEQRLIMAAIDINGASVAAPKIGEEITFAGVKFLVVEVSPLAPDGTPIIHDCVVK